MQKLLSVIVIKLYQKSVLDLLKQLYFSYITTHYNIPVKLSIETKSWF